MICSNCKREPESFELSDGQTGYWFIADKSDGDASYLMSDFSHQFKCCVDIEPELEENEIVICVRCVDAELES